LGGLPFLLSKSKARSAGRGPPAAILFVQANKKDAKNGFSIVGFSKSFQVRLCYESEAVERAWQKPEKAATRKLTRAVAQTVHYYVFLFFSTGLFIRLIAPTLFLPRPVEQLVARRGLSVLPASSVNKAIVCVGSCSTPN